MDDETPEIFEEREVKSRKEHKCCECHRPIREGDKYWRAKGLWRDSGWHEYKTCGDCRYLRNEVDDYFGPPAFGFLSESVEESGLEMPT